jgi:HKD family nuclease
MPVRSNEVRKLIKEKYGAKTGSLRLVVEEALKQALVPSSEISAATLLETIDYVSRASKENQPKDQILTNVYLTLDRQFEQSIMRGLDDSKNKRKTKTAPKVSDPVEFLRSRYSIVTRLNMSHFRT